MSPDLKYLTWSVALTLLQVVIAGIGIQTQVGLAAMVGNRDDLPEVTGWAARAVRAHRNMLENFVLFVALVLTAHAAGKANATTALGAELFFWARVVYVPVYVIGIPWVRTGIWVVSLVGMGLIFGQLM